MLVPHELDVVEQGGVDLRVRGEGDGVTVYESGGVSGSLTRAREGRRRRVKRRERGESGDEKEERKETHVCSFSNNFFAGLPSFTFAILTGFTLIHSRITSCTNVRGALVLIEPGTACEREMV